MNILVLNAGSSSQKSCLYAISNENLPDQAPPPVWEAQIDSAGDSKKQTMQVKTAAGANLTEALPETAPSDAIAHMLETLWSGKTQVIANKTAIGVVGHRVVHGGSEYQESVRITPDVKATIARLSELAPAHNPANLQGIEAVETALGDVPQVAAFDTAFHSHLPEAAAIYPGPAAWLDRGIRRYGFHGISHRYCAHRAAQILNRDLNELRLITCHLGNGCSLAAVRNGRSIDTTMGFTPLDGLMMGSRSGSVDPGILIYLLRHDGATADSLDHVLNAESGLKGVSGVSSDMRQIQQAVAQGNPDAKRALDVYIHRLRQEIGAMLASLGGLDALVFTAGVGENSADVRAAACAPFAFLGLKLDPDQNARSPVDADIAAPDSTVRVLVLHTQEDWSIAQDCWRIIRA